MNNLIDELSQFSSIIFQVSLGLLPHSHIGQTLQPLNNLIAHKVGPFSYFLLLPISHPQARPLQVLCGRLVRPDRLHGLRLPPVAEQSHDDALRRAQTGC